MTRSLFNKNKDKLKYHQERTRTYNAFNLVRLTFYKKIPRKKLVEFYNMYDKKSINELNEEELIVFSEWLENYEEKNEPSS